MSDEAGSNPALCAGVQCCEAHLQGDESERAPRAAVVCTVDLHYRPPVWKELHPKLLYEVPDRNWRVYSHLVRCAHKPRRTLCIFPGNSICPSSVLLRNRINLRLVRMLVANTLNFRRLTHHFDIFMGHVGALHSDKRRLHLCG